ncbi:UNVERIFIED_ORG: ubiquinone/menaquinone biosynthesis C-methylase UbiE [Rhizobium esperanzae]
MSELRKRAENQQKIYQRWAPVYDRVYRGILRDGHRKLAALAAAAGTDILEIGTGTGLTLAHYPIRCRVTGIDISEHMIARAREKVRRENLQHVQALEVMDAHALRFADQSFDVVCLPFVITLIPEPERALDECARVLRPGARSSSPASSATAPACRGRSKRRWRRWCVTSAGLPPSASIASSPGPSVAAIFRRPIFCRSFRTAFSRSSG